MSVNEDSASKMPPTNGKPEQENHVDNANFLHGITAYGHIDEAGSLETMSVKFNYFEESDEPLRMENLKTMKFWMYREDATAFALAILKSAKRE